jgi:hypothetical protein
MILAKRKVLFEAAKTVNALRCSKEVKNCHPIAPITLYPKALEMQVGGKYARPLEHRSTL